MKRKLSAGLGLTLLLAGMLSAAASAHVVVKPASVGIGAYQTFTIGVPTEKDMPTVALRLVIPAGLTSVSPNVKPGWTIEEQKTGEGENAVVSEINWTGGSIPAGQRDDFVFSAKSPSKPVTLQWKAYQTYQDGSVVAWDQAPVKAKDIKADANAPEPTPYSETKVVNDLTASPAPAASAAKANDAKEDNKLPLIFSIVALVLSLVAVSRASRSRNPATEAKSKN